MLPAAIGRDAVCVVAVNPFTGKMTCLQGYERFNSGLLFIFPRLCPLFGYTAASYGFIYLFMLLNTLR